MSSQAQQPPSFDYSQMVASGAIAGSNARSGAAVGEGQPQQGGIILGTGAKELQLPVGDITDNFAIANGDTMFAPLNQGGGAFGQSLTSQLGEMTNYLGTREARGDNLALEQLSGGDMNNMRAPTVQGDLQLKALSAKGSSTPQQG